MPEQEFRAIVLRTDSTDSNGKTRNKDLNLEHTGQLENGTRFKRVMRPKITVDKGMNQQSLTHLHDTSMQSIAQLQGRLSQNASMENFERTVNDILNSDKKLKEKGDIM